jgi:hypothetical protein
MKRKTLLVIIAIIIVIGATAGGVYYYTSLGSTAPQDSEPESTVPEEEEPTSTPPQEEEQDTTDSASAPWTITKISSARTKGFLAELPSPTLNVTHFPSNEDDIFLVVNFELDMTVEAEALDVQKILVIVDAIHELSPSGWCIWSGEGYVGNFSGTITQEGVDVQIVVEVSSLILSSPHTVSMQFDLTEPLIFVYVLPRTYLDGTHNFQLQISDSAEGVEFTVES